MTGEDLSIHSVPGGSTGSFSNPCPDLGASSGSGTFSASGPATGPYPGTFTETGSYTWDDTTGAFTLAASFTITANDGTIVTGTKSYPVAGSTFNYFDDMCNVDVTTAYSATIQTSSGAFHDEGLVETILSSPTAPDPNDFEEGLFASGLPATTPLPPALPTDKTQCTNGGWRTYNVFKNQGDCVSFVATHGKNGPNG